MTLTIVRGFVVTSTDFEIISSRQSPFPLIVLFYSVLNAGSLRPHRSHIERDGSAREQSSSRAAPQLLDCASRAHLVGSARIVCSTGRFRTGNNSYVLKKIT
jgi:hypothetical protein